MKVEEIKLAFESNQKFELTVVSDMNEAINSAEKDYEKAKKLAQDTKMQFSFMEIGYNAAMKFNEKAIAMGKELGTDIKWFEQNRATLKIMLDIAVKNKNKFSSLS